MAVYIGTRKYNHGRWVMSHMIADTLEELHRMAAHIGVKRRHFQDKPGKPHYDVCQIRAKHAIKHLGAKLVNDREIIKILKEKYGTGQ